MVVVADASPLIFLSRLDLLRLLADLYDRVLVPEQVFEEIVAGGVDAPGSAAIQTTNWIEVVALAGDQQLRNVLEEQLDAGEAAAISLAMERKADLLLIDERQGRRIARRLGLQVKGTVGLLIAARRQHLLDELKPVLVRLSQEGAWISDDLLSAALNAVGEKQEEGDR